MNIEEIKLNLANNLKRLRKERGMSQHGLADVTGISRDAISRYELSIDKPPLDKLLILANTFNMTFDELVGFKQVKTEDNKISDKVLKKARLIDKLPTRAQNEIFKLIGEKVEKSGIE